MSFNLKLIHIWNCILWNEYAWFAVPIPHHLQLFWLIWWTNQWINRALCSAAVHCAFELNKPFSFWGDFWPNHVKNLFEQNKKRSKHSSKRWLVQFSHCVIVICRDYNWSANIEHRTFWTCLNQGQFNIRTLHRRQFAVNFVQSRFSIWIEL